MNIYFTASIVGKRYNLQNYQKIVSRLQSKHQVQADHILAKTEDQIRLESKKERELFHQQMNQWISNSDCMVVEATFPSISVGYEISLALHWRKPILVLYSEGDPPSLLEGYNESLIICELYTIKTLNRILDDFLDYAQGSSDTRFTFFLPTDLAHHLEISAQKKHVSKANYLRQLLWQDKLNLS